MDIVPQLLLIAGVAGVGILHTVVPDHWVPIAVIARQRAWSPRDTAMAAFQAGTGHVVSTLIIALVVWLAGALAAERFGQLIDTMSSIALIGFGSWIAVVAWRDLRRGADNVHGHSHGHGFSHSHDFTPSTDDHVHGPELRRMTTGRGSIELSIYEHGVPPRFRLTRARPLSVTIQRDDGTQQIFRFANRGAFWESIDEIPEPHGFDVAVTVAEDGGAKTYRTRFVEHTHDPDHLAHRHDYHLASGRPALRDDLYAPLAADLAVLTHLHAHRHGSRSVHTHRHDHLALTAHELDKASVVDPPEHQHKHKTSARTALLLIVGSSPMVEGIPAFFAASRYGIALIVAMSVVFALSTIVTYVALCVFSTAGLQRLRFGAVERYGEVLSGGFIALVGLAFWIWPVL